MWVDDKTKKRSSFEEKKNEIINAINNKKLEGFGINEPASLIDWIFSAPLNDELNGNFVLWWKSLPMVMLIWINTGRVYFIALKSLLPNVNLDGNQ